MTTANETLENIGESVDNGERAGNRFPLQCMKLNVSKQKNNSGGRAHSRRTVASTWVDFIVKQSPGIHPNLRQSGIVAVYDAPSAPRERIRRRLAEHVPDMRARHNEQSTPTHPYLWACEQGMREERNDETKR